MVDRVDEKDLLKFNRRGHLIPGCHLCNLNEFFNAFVKQFPNSETRNSRKELFLKFLKKAM
jgi:hypothetical protein